LESAFEEIDVVVKYINESMLCTILLFNYFQFRKKIVGNQIEAERSF